jgi:CRISPR/Cas system-associated endonuclease Cas1
MRYRSSLATDLMEPARPVADEIVLDLLESRLLHRGDVVETRERVVRVGASVARYLAGHAVELRAAVAPHGEALARLLLRSPNHPIPMTRARHRRALAGTR